MAPIISARWYPYVIFEVAGSLETSIEQILMKKPETSLNICAASVMMANELASRPPISSTSMNMMQIMLTKISFFKADDLSECKSGIL